MALEKTQRRLDVLTMADECRLLYDGDTTFYLRDEFELLAAAVCDQRMQVAGREVLAEAMIQGNPLSAVLINGEQLVPLTLTSLGSGTLLLWRR